ncbi:MAG: ribosomal protein S18-alanine N-acetyltransferase [Candidatus Bathyarchaeota archaeon]|nr:ribosomal protein S18-alanine N-acetyltransferase [Candidatus Bathyarchaeota archaeon]MCX8177002.1 ribosomal protein S18-alanine N-acetyltransferase [Candidatus Bathyarchaeota archaeon]MDW8194400.1 ribosomal protein S18-alanine N-acetyltransferase [Nitrososphaerota archaeon]
MAISIEDVSLEFLERLYEIEKECFRKEAFTKQQIAKLLMSPNSVGLVAKVNGEIIGFIIGALHYDNDQLVGHILTIDISEKYRRKGIGVKLLQEMEKIFAGKGVAKCRLEVREDNIAAIKLYSKLGYKKAGMLPYYYKDKHGILFEKNLQAC